MRFNKLAAFFFLQHATGRIFYPCEEDAARFKRSEKDGTPWFSDANYAKGKPASYLRFRATCCAQLAAVPKGALHLCLEESQTVTS